MDYIPRSGIIDSILYGFIPNVLVDVVNQFKSLTDPWVEFNIIGDIVSSPTLIIRMTRTRIMSPPVVGGVNGILAIVGRIDTVVSVLATASGKPRRLTLILLLFHFVCVQRCLHSHAHPHTTYRKLSAGKIKRVKV